MWLTTGASLFSMRGGFSNPRGERTHAVRIGDGETVKKVGRRRALCGLLPAHGWLDDPAIDEQCARCRSHAVGGETP